jgi:GT2 family glycosyltransferase
VEILVSDNHSGDDAYAMSKSMLANYPNVQVVRQSANIGYAGNLMALASLSRGEYLWFIGAGDTVFPGCLAEIIQIL